MEHQLAVHDVRNAVRLTEQHQLLQAVAIANLDAVLLEARDSLEALPEHLLAELEDLLHMRFELPAQQQADDAEAAPPGAPHRSTRRPTAAVPPGALLI